MSEISSIEGGNDVPLVSVIVPVYNEKETIAECIESLLNQTYENVEIIIVDDGSTDGSYQIATKYPVRVVKVEENKGVSYARNLGAKLAKGDYVIFAEADAKYAPNYVEGMIAPLQNENVGGVNAVREPWTDKNNVIVRRLRLGAIAIRELIKRGERPVIGAWAFRRDLFKKLEGYDENLSCGEDVDFVNRMKIAGCTAVWTLNTYYYHKDPDTFRKLIKRTWWGAVKCKEFRERWGLEPKGLKKLFFIGRNISALLLPVYPVPALIHSIFWLLIFFGVFFAESVFPIIYDKELKLTFKLALKEKDYKLALAMPFICWVEIRTRALGIFYAMLTSRCGSEK